MLLKVKVFVGNITNLSDARYCAGMGVDMLGFPIGNEVGKIAFESFLEIAEWVSGPSIVLEYSDTMDDSMFEKVTQSGIIHAIRLNGKQLHYLHHRLSSESVILDTELSEWKSLMTKYGSYVASLIVHDAISDDNIPLMEEINKEIQVFLPFKNIKIETEKIPDLPVTGIVLSGSDEDKPGQKDYDALASVLEALEVD